MFTTTNGKYIESAKWEPVERHLRSIFLAAIKELPFEPDRLLKYTASATEQEIISGAMNVPDAQEHVYCFFRSIKNLPSDHNARDFIDLDDKCCLDSEANHNLHDLKKRLQTILPNNIYTYETKWTHDGITKDHIEKLCEDVYKSLSSVILKEIEQLEKIDPLEKEIADHAAFGKERTRFFTGRAGILQTISEYADGKNSCPLVVFGVSGSGKTALMARAAELVQHDHPNTVVFFRFIGATPDSSNGHALLESLCRQIYHTFKFEEQKRARFTEISYFVEIKGTSEESLKMRQDIDDEYAIPPDFPKLSLTFRDFLTKIPIDNKLILFLDALDHLPDIDHARNLSWLPTELQYNVRIVVSTLPGECLYVLEHKLKETNLIELKPMLLNEGRELLGLWFENARRTLQASQWNEVMDKFSVCRLPLYLKLAFEEARRWKSYTEKTELSKDIPGIIRDLFERLSQESNHGKILVSHSLGYLTAAKNGMTEPVGSVCCGGVFIGRNKKKTARGIGALFLQSSFEDRKGKREKTKYPQGI